MIRTSRKNNLTMSYSAYHDFSLDNTLGAYEPSPEFRATVVSHDEAPGWVLRSYYSANILFGAIAIVTAAGQIYTRMRCTHFKTPTSVTGSDIFEVFAWITAILGFLLIILSLLALIYKMGITTLLSKGWTKLAGSTKESDAKFRMNELQSRLGKQDDLLVQGAGQSSLSRSLDRTFAEPYPNVKLG